MPTAAAPNGSTLILSARHKIFGQRTVWALNVSGLIGVSVQRHQEADPAPPFWCCPTISSQQFLVSIFVAGNSHNIDSGPTALTDARGLAVRCLSLFYRLCLSVSLLISMLRAQPDIHSIVTCLDLTCHYLASALIAPINTLCQPKSTPKLTENALRTFQVQIASLYLAFSSAKSCFHWRFDSFHYRYTFPADNFSGVI